MINPLKHVFKRKVGLALGSGGAKGVAHIAVLNYLKGMGIPVDMIAGSSIGSVVGALYCAGVMDRFTTDLLSMGKRDLITYFDPVFPRSGLIQGKRVINLMEEYIPRDMLIEDLPVPLAVCATEYSNGLTVVFRKGNLLDAVRASISIPGVMIPVKYRGTFLIDGGVANPLPVNIVKSMGARIIIAVNLHPRIGTGKIRTFVKSEMGRFQLIMDADELELPVDAPPVITPSKDEKKSWGGTISHWLGTEKPKTPREELPSIIDTLSKSFDIMEYVNTVLTLKYNRPTVLIEPDVVGYGTFDFNEAASILEEGNKACLGKLGALKRRVSLWV